MSRASVLGQSTRSSARPVHVLLAEDEPALMDLLRYNFEASGYRVLPALDGEEAELLVKENQPDLLLLDWMLPGVSGIELLRRLRRKQATATLPVIVITGRDSEADRVRALETGADDFLAKPFSVAELMARVHALLRRTGATRFQRIVGAGDTEIDRDAMTVRRRGKIVLLGPTDLRLLEFFLEAPGRVHSREALLDGVWGRDCDVDERTIDVHIGRVRKALLSAWRSDPIKTVRGVGYRYDPK